MWLQAEGSKQHSFHSVGSSTSCPAQCLCSKLHILGCWSGMKALCGPIRNHIQLRCEHTVVNVQLVLLPPPCREAHLRHMAPCSMCAQSLVCCIPENCKSSRVSSASVPGGASPSCTFRNRSDLGIPSAAAPLLQSNALANRSIGMLLGKPSS